jgi:excisionase family DNA binding protein
MSVMKPGEQAELGRGFVTVPEAARYLAVSRAKLYAMMDAGDVRYAKFGKSRRIPVEALRELGERCLVGTGR